MVASQLLTTISPEEYDTLESALLETTRGRWFLSEYARRNRHADTDVLLDAIGRLENAVKSDRAPQGLDRLRFDLMEMAKAISRTKSEIAAIHAPDHDQSRLIEASEALDAIVRTTERATSDILEAAEEVQEVAWTLRESGADTKVCNALDHNATQIYTACSFQDLTAQRTSRIVNTLRYLEQRVNAMIAIWAEEGEEPIEPVRSPAPVAVDLNQGDVDAMIATPTPPAAGGPPRLTLVEPAEPLDDLAFVPVPEEVATLGEVPAPDLTVVAGTEVQAGDIPSFDAGDEPTTRAEGEGEDRADGETGAAATKQAEILSLTQVFHDVDRLILSEKLGRFS
ncbi:MAG: hypothetical protein PGN34_03595 [Methylobacterium frigidaeris]